MLSKMCVHHFLCRINRFSDFVHHPNSKELEDKKHDISETGSVSILRWGETPTLLGPLERANLNHQYYFLQFHQMPINEIVKCISEDFNQTGLQCHTRRDRLKSNHSLTLIQISSIILGSVTCWEMKWQEIGGNCIMRSFIICTPRQTQLEWSSQGGSDGLGI
jgi:hypothetical protein